MKKTTLFLILLAFTCHRVSAQSVTPAEIDYIQSIYGMEKKAVVSEFIKLEDTKKDAFWTVYDEYEIKRKAQAKLQIGLLQKYVTEYLELDDVKTAELMKASLKQRKATEKLLTQYYNKMRKVVGAKTASQFIQLESYFLNLKRVQLMETIPFIGELDD